VSIKADKKESESESDSESEEETKAHQKIVRGGDSEEE